MNLDFYDTLWYIALIIFGAPLINFLSDSEFEYQKDKKKVIASIVLAPILILLIASAIFGIDETTNKIGILFGDFLRFVIYLIYGLLFFTVLMIMFVFLISDNKREVIEKIKIKLFKIGRKNK